MSQKNQDLTLPDYIDQARNWSVYLLCIFIPISKSGVEIFATSAGILGLVQLGLQLKRTGFRTALREKFTETPELIGAVCIFSAALLSSFLSLEASNSLRLTFGKLGEYLLLFAAISSAPRAKLRIDHVLRSLLTGSFCFAVLVLSQAATDPAFFSVFYSCLSDGTLAGVPGMTYFSRIGGFAGMLAPILLMTSVYRSQYFSVDPFQRAALHCTAILLFCCIPLSRSPSAMLGTLLVISWLWLAKARKSEAQIRKKFILLGSIGVLANSSGLLWEWESTGNFVEFHFSQCYRFVWEIGFQLFYQQPWQGVGFGVYQPIAGRLPETVGGLTYPPSSLVQILVETGLLGFTSYLLLGGLFFRRLFKLRSSLGDPILCGMWAGVGAFLFQSITDNNLYSVQLSALFWTILGLIVLRMQDLPEQNLETN